MGFMKIWFSKVRRAEVCRARELDQSPRLGHIPAQRLLADHALELGPRLHGVGNRLDDLEARVVGRADDHAVYMPGQLAHAAEDSRRPQAGVRASAANSARP